MKAFTLLLATLMVATPVYAFGISTPYWGPDYPLRLEPGQSTEFVLTLQNMADVEPVALKVEWIDNAGIAQFTNPRTTVTVPSGRDDITVPIRVGIPQDAPVGTTYNLHVMFTSVSEAEGGTVALATGVEKIIPVEVVAEAPEEQAPAPAKEAGMSTTTAVMLAIIVIILLAILFFGKKKKK